jgi:hypothetical protein
MRAAGRRGGADDGPGDQATGRPTERQAMLVRTVEEARRVVAEPTRTERPAEAVEPHQQPGTTQARWIGRSREALAPIVVRWSMDDSPR